MVIRTSNVISEMREASFKYIVCSNATITELDRRSTPDLVGKVQADDRITITGIYWVEPIEENPRVRNIKTMYRTHIVHYRKIDMERSYEKEEVKDHIVPPEHVELLRTKWWYFIYFILLWITDDDDKYEKVWASA